ncbi:MAG: ATP-grasp domain-containing protein, partial [Promethearchaeota archaeon]
KPEDGVGAEDIYYFDSEEKILETFSKNTPLIDRERTYILQKFVEGKDLSVSLIGCKDSPIIIGINAQNVVIKDVNKESRYIGGYTPVENWERLVSKLEKHFNTVEFEPFDSYFGIDFIQQENGALSFIEINPRLTTSYIGIRNTINQNLIEVLMNARNNEFNVDELEFQNFSKYGNLTLKYEGSVCFLDVNEIIIPQILKMIPEIITPPIKIKNIHEDFYSCFIATKTKDILSSETRINEIINIFKKRNFFIKSLELI